MPDKPNFVLVPYEAPPPSQPRGPQKLAARLRALLGFAAPGELQPAADEPVPLRPRLVFAFDATASREPAFLHTYPKAIGGLRLKQISIRVRDAMRAVPKSALAFRRMGEAIAEGGERERCHPENGPVGAARLL